jgi:serine/threonine-protein kinase
MKLGKYEIRRRIGTGAMGIVYEGWDPGIGRRVAIKTLKQDLLDSPESADVLARFRREAQAAGRLNHPNIVAVHELGESDGIMYIAMEYVDGRELKDFCDRGERFPLGQAVRIVCALLAALDVAHAAGVVHRDIKPGNIFLVGNDGIKVGDFGVARVESSELTQAGSVLGTPSYMSPEQISGQVVDGRADLFSAGVILYQLLTGERPFQGTSLATIMHKLLKEEPTPPSVINVHVPPAFDAVITKALAKRPEGRYQTGAEFAAAIQAAAGQTAPAVSHDEPMIVDTATIALTPPAGSTAPARPAPAAPASLPPRETPPVRPTQPSRTPAPPPLPTARSKSNTGALTILVGLLVVSAGALWWWLMGMPLPFATRPATSTETPAAPASGTPTANPLPVAPPSEPARISLSVRPTSGREQFRPGERIVLDIVPGRDAHIYCFMQDESGAIARFFPNRFATGSRVPASGVRIPGEGQFNINANARGAREEIACYAADTDILGQVTAVIGAGDIDKPVSVTSMADLDKVFFTAGGATLGLARLPIQPR